MKHYPARNILLATIAIVFTFISSIGQTPEPGGKGIVKTLVLDAGHGGKDPGAVGLQYRESQLTLQMALKLGQLVRNQFPEVKVIYTRDKDEFVPLHDRVRKANKVHADLFVSIHCNALPGNPNTEGTETYVLGLHRSDDNLAVAKRENASIVFEKDYKNAYGGYDPYSNEGHIILSMFQNTYLDQSIRFADQVEKQMKLVTERKSRGVKQAGFLVLREATMPAVLVEVGYLSHAREEQYLGSEEGQWLIANALLRSIQAYWFPDQPLLPLPTPSTKITPALATKDSGSTKTKNLVKPTATQLTAKGGTPEKELPAVQFYVQVKAEKAAKPELATRILDQSYTCEVKKEEGYFKYLAGSFESAEKARAAKQVLEGTGFSGCFLVAYLSGKRITMEEASKLAR